MKLERYLVKESGHYCTPIVFMTNRHHRTVALIGVGHVGLISYYQEIQSLLDTAEAEGCVITHEGADWSAAYEKGFPPFTAEQWTALKPLVSAVEQALAPTGISEQGFVVRPRKSWVFTDSLHAEAVGTWQLKSIRASLESVAADPRAYLRELLPKFERHISECPDPTPLFAERDAEAAESILGFAESYNVASCWGARHLAGINKQLEQNGFETVEIKWLRCLPTEIH